MQFNVATIFWAVALTLSVIAFLAACKKGKLYTFLFAGSLTLIGTLILYRPYLTGETSILYTVIDGFSQYLSQYTNFSQQFASGEFPSWWNMSIGFGTVRSYDLILNPFILFPVLCGTFFGETALECGFAWMQVLKIFLTAMFMYKFLKKIHFGNYVCTFCSTAFAFCGVIILRGHWVYLADECYLAVLILLCVEYFFQDGKWYFIPPVVFLLGCSLGFYYLYLYALLLAIYATARYVYAKRPAKGYVKYILTCGGIYALGCLMCFFIFSGFSLWSMFSTERFASTSSNLGATSLFSLVDSQVLTSAALSLFDTSSAGVFHAYSGALGYLEQPVFYCGLGCLFLIPQAFICGQKRPKILISFGLGLAALYMFLPAVVDVFCAFIHNEESGLRSYRLSTLWICIVMIVAAGYGLQCMIRTPYKGRNELLVTFVGIFFLLLFCCVAAPSNGLTIDYQVVQWVVIALFAWMILLYWFIGSKQTYMHGTQLGVVLLLVLNIGGMICSAGTVLSGSIREATNNEKEMREDVFGYYSEVNELVDFIKKEDDGLYRIAGIRPDAGLGVPTYCTPMYFGIYDSSYYTNIDSNTYNFLNAVYPESFDRIPGSKFSVGVGDNVPLATLTDYKYLIRVYDPQSDKADNKKDSEKDDEEYNEDNTPIGYKEIKNTQHLQLLKNEYALSIGVTYQKYMKTSVFNKYPDDVQRLLMLKAVILEDDAKTDLEEMTEDDIVSICGWVEGRNIIYSDLAQDMQKHCLEVISWQEDKIEGTVTEDKDSILCISTPPTRGWTVTVDGKEVPISTVNVGFIGIPLKKGTHKIVVEYKQTALAFGACVSLIAVAVFGLLFALRRKIVITSGFEQIRQKLRRQDRTVITRTGKVN